jgi:cell division protein FtsL
MSQAAYAIAYNVQKALRYRERIVMALIVTIVASASMYVYFVQKAVWNTMERGQITKQIQGANLAINNLENNYLTLENNVTIDTATQMGFTPAHVTNFISSKSLGKAAQETNEI